MRWKVYWLCLSMIRRWILPRDSVAMVGLRFNGLEIFIKSLREGIVICPPGVILFCCSLYRCSNCPIICRAVTAVFCFFIDNINLSHPVRCKLRLHYARLFAVDVIDVQCHHLQCCYCRVLFGIDNVPCSQPTRLHLQRSYA